MADLFDTSRLPDRDAYWDAVAERVAANVARKSKASGFEWLAHSRTSWVAASVLLVAALAFMVLPTESSPLRKSAEWEQALAPTDDVGKAIVWQDAPPAIGALLLGGQTGG